MANKFLADLQIQIESIHNTRDFERLVNELFSRIYGADYIPSRYHGDRGLDGYISSPKILVAKHCFENPQQRGTSDIFKKAREDLEKAKKLSKRFPIKKWMFITSYPIPTEVLITLKREVNAAGFDFACPGPSFIASELFRHKDLIQSFPELHVGQIAENIKEMKETLETIKEKISIPITEAQLDKKVEESSKPEAEKAQTFEEPSLPQKPFRTAPKKEDSRDFKRLLEIYKCSPSAELEKEVKSIIYSSKDQGAVLQGVHLLVSWYRFSKDTVDDFMVFVNIGIDVAKNLKSLDSEAILLAEKASLLSVKFVLMDLEGWGEIRMSEVTGLPLITDEKRAAIVSELKRLNQEFNELFKDAMQKAHASNSYLAVTRVFSIVGDSAGNRAGHFLSLGIMERAVIEKGLCKGTFVYAKSIAVQFKDEREMAYVLWNFSNALGFIDEADEALMVLKEAVGIAKKYRMNDLLGNIGRLEKLIKEPKIRLVNNE
jgi:hypothetical protein